MKERNSPHHSLPLLKPNPMTRLMVLTWVYVLGLSPQNIRLSYSRMRKLGAAVV